MARPRTITDERLLTAAAAVIEQAGPGFTLAQVAREAGVAVGSVAQRFGSKAGLLRALTELGRTQAVERMRGAAAEADSPAAAVRSALLAVFAGLDNGGDSGVANHLAQLGTDLADPELRGLLGLHYAALRGELTVLLRAVPDSGWRGPEPDVAARVLLSAVNGAALDWSLRADDATNDTGLANDIADDTGPANNTTAANEAGPVRGTLRACLAETVDMIMKGWLP
ncbi:MULTISPECIES: TetR/AcrR family transcriptional regulator [Prauserella salsuginis group]|uniref:AcrR family transcriptional regulator n=2 Tax=Prauserella salsuginis group TaxID=2893672 RepID=A0A839XMT4_9PSEU|nr:MULTISPECIES: TetR/AcrR family transcriptional regulator [Prauserella salsuginis group]MBB3662814.1 AcrR family transcriptional regulator [Prauserella sediminis]MCR3720510.1 transcriptional regulator, TetR family [Prauserella flava]MCR3733780.1 transcriptional regulator, TetR family [Prauserella salsuginis]